MKRAICGVLGVLGGLLAGCVTVEDTARRDAHVGISAMAMRFADAAQEKGRSTVVVDVLAAVTNSMKDPDSVRFRAVRVVRYGTGAVVCGEVNAKNSYGGYTGFSPFVGAPSRVIVRRESRDAAVLGINWAIFDVCEMGEEIPAAASLR